MTAKQFLKQYEYAMDRVAKCEREYQEAVENIDAIGSTLAGDGMPHGNGISRKTEDKAIKLTEIRDKWARAKAEALAERQKVVDLIIDIPGIEGNVLYERYIELKTWEQIANALFYSYTGIFYVHKRALEIVEKRLNGE